MAYLFFSFFIIVVLFHRCSLFVGSDILVRAITDSNWQTIQMYFPGGDNEQWVSLFDDDVRAGSGTQDVDIDISHVIF